MDNLQHQARYFYESTEESSTEQTKQAWTIYNIKQLNTPQIHLKQAVQAQHHQQATGPNPRRCHTIHRKQVPTKRLTSASEKPYVCKKNQILDIFTDGQGGAVQCMQTKQASKYQSTKKQILVKLSTSWIILLISKTTMKIKLG
jgi:hypothetical protein